MRNVTDLPLPPTIHFLLPLYRNHFLCASVIIFSFRALLFYGVPSVVYFSHQFSGSCQHRKYNNIINHQDNVNNMQLDFTEQSYDLDSHFFFQWNQSYWHQILRGVIFFFRGIFWLFFCLSLFYYIQLYGGAIYWWAYQENCCDRRAARQLHGAMTLLIWS